MKGSRLLAAALLLLILAVFALSACDLALGTSPAATTTAPATGDAPAATTTTAATTTVTAPVNNDNEIDAGDIFG